MSDYTTNLTMEPQEPYQLKVAIDVLKHFEIEPEGSRAAKLSVNPALLKKFKSLAVYRHETPNIMATFMGVQIVESPIAPDDTIIVQNIYGRVIRIINLKGKSP